MNIEPGSTIWIYVKVPVGSIVGSVLVKSVHQLSPTRIWQQFGSACGLSRRELYKYFEGAKRGFAVELESPEVRTTSLSLELLRQISTGFQPPQFFWYLNEEHPLYETVVAS